MSAGDGVSDAGSACFGEKLAGEFGFLVGARDRKGFLGGLLEMRGDGFHTERGRDSANLGELFGDRVGCHGSYGAASVADAASRFYAPSWRRGMTSTRIRARLVRESPREVEKRRGTTRDDEMRFRRSEHGFDTRPLCRSDAASFCQGWRRGFESCRPLQRVCRESAGERPT